MRKIKNPLSNYFLEIAVKEWYDKTSSAYIIYSKKYDVSGYGNTRKKAHKLFKVTLEEILKPK